MLIQGRNIAMDHYASEPLIEQCSDPFPFDIENDPSYFQIKIENKSASVRTLANRGLKNFGSGKKIVFIAQGRATTKAVSCVEIMKTYYKKPVHQITRISQIKTVETWYPLVEGLDPIRITRSVPVINILISQEPLNADEEGYQVYNHRDPKKVLNMQQVEEHDEKQDAIDNSEQKENIPTTTPSDNINEDDEQEEES
ncbi:Ribonuclease P protein subunit p25-like protein [Orchesella cincta]|uniref:Ribonuclease P protein subunit p25-like protein n=1 Tax=Orchesella cincta TaxID=48709 RepID=A0A1D2M3H2_ORCCI|nr:Ribonuclease P protein subunit p25-like protein [Orchesella cincta]